MCKLLTVFVNRADFQKGLMEGRREGSNRDNLCGPFLALLFLPRVPPSLSVDSTWQANWGTRGKQGCYLLLTGYFLGRAIHMQRAGGLRLSLWMLFYLSILILPVIRRYLTVVWVEYQSIWVGFLPSPGCFGLQKTVSQEGRCRFTWFWHTNTKNCYIKDATFQAVAKVTQDWMANPESKL